MAPRLNFDGSLEDGLRRIAGRYFDRLEQKLEPRGDRIVAVHEARKSIKRLRALVDLAANAAPRRARRLDRKLRALGRAMTAERDLQILLPAYQGLISAYGRSDAEWPRLAMALAATASASPAALASSIDPAGIARCRRACGDLPLERLSTVDLAHACARNYRCGRRIMKTLDATASSEQFHEWRKTVQRHWRHMQVLESAWPREFVARQESAHALADALGDEHDLEILRLWIRSHAAAAKERAGARRLEVLIDLRQRELRNSALSIGERLFAERAGAFRRRLAIYLSSPEGDTGTTSQTPTVGRKAEPVVRLARPV